MKSSQSAHWNTSELPLDRLLLESPVSGCVLTLSSNERPPLGWAGLLDWRTHGAISDSIRNGIFKGEAGECCYFPWSRKDKTVHLMLLGIGKVAEPGARGAIPVTSLSALERNLRKLSGIQWAISSSEFPEKSWPSLVRSLPEGGALWITA